MTREQERVNTMTPEQFEMVRNIAISQDLHGQIKAWMNKSGKRIEFHVEGCYYGTWDLKKCKWVDL